MKLQERAIDSEFSRLDAIFNPKSVALAGVTVANPEHWTRTFLDSLTEFGFSPLYLVNPKGGEINGQKIYTSIEEVPGDIDYVIATVPARAAPELVRECSRKGVKAVHFCTSGFAETGEEEGARLQQELVEAARQNGIRIIGPNCMGMYCPERKLSFNIDFPKESGSVGYISQSGGNATTLIAQAMHRGIRFSKVISYGNACDLNEADYLEYLTDDPATQIICLYIEGVREGYRFRRALERAARVKTVVALKGGITPSGSRATIGHTGSLAGSGSTWDAMCRQFRIIQVGSVEEMADILVTLQFMPVYHGPRAALIGFGGGASVLITDTFEKNGLVVPPLPEDLKAQIRSFTPIAGNIFHNPVDYSQSLGELDLLARTMGILSGWDSADFMVCFMSPSRMTPATKRALYKVLGIMQETSSAGSKPLAVIIEPSVVPVEAMEIKGVIEGCVAQSLPVYYSFPSAAHALNLVLKYYKARGKEEPS